MFLLGETLHLFGPPPIHWIAPPTPSCILSQGYLVEQSLRPSESIHCEFLWVEILSGCFILLPIKMNCHYVLCPDNHLVETQKKLQNGNEVISLKWLIGAF